jgi:hypothetical protein
LPVVRIVRVRIGSLLLGTLKPGQWRHLTELEVQELRGKKPAPPQKPRRTKLSLRKKSSPRSPG